MPAKWDDKTTCDLFMSIMTVVAPGDLKPEQKAHVEALMREKGHNVNWNGIRYAISSFYQKPTLPQSQCLTALAQPS